MNHTSNRTLRLATTVAAALFGATMILASATAGTAACGICGKNLIKNPGAEAGLGITAVDAFGSCPAGPLSPASSAPPRTSSRTAGSRHGRRARRTGARTTSSVEPLLRLSRRRHRSARRRSSCPPRRSARWPPSAGGSGNYGKNRSQVRAQFEDEAGTLLSMVKIGPDPTIGSTDMSARIRSGKVPAGTKQVTIIVSFAGGGAAYKLAGADALSLILK